MARIAQAASTHAWSVSESRGGLMATRESGRIGEPWVVTAVHAGRGLRISFYRPGDALDVQGEDLGELAGNPRELGRALRSLLEDLAGGEAA